jgi:pimeloyl-ACP methyl ester carboxylesterase
MMWEATDECVGFVTEFLTGVSEGRRDALALPVLQDSQTALADFVHLLRPALELFANWPWMLAGTGVDSMTIVRQSIYFSGKAQFGDGKPVVLIPDLTSHLPFQLLSNWLKALGYRPVTTGLSVTVHDQSVADLIRAVTQRIGRKAVLVTAASGVQHASAVAEAHKERVSDIVVLNALHRPDMAPGIRSHFISSGWSLLLAMATLPQVLRNIRIELIEASSSVDATRSTADDRQLSAEGGPK